MFFSENRCFYEIMYEKQGKAGQATDNNIIWLIRLACKTTMAADTPSSSLFPTAFHAQQR